MFNVGEIMKKFSVFENLTSSNEIKDNLKMANSQNYCECEGLQIQQR